MSIFTPPILSGNPPVKYLMCKLLVSLGSIPPTFPEILREVLTLDNNTLFCPESS